jgi:hypothetical protein
MRYVVQCIWSEERKDIFRNVIKAAVGCCENACYMKPWFRT